MCPPPFLITASRRRCHSMILLSMKRREFLPLTDYRSLQFFHRLELSLVVDSLLKSIPNSVIHGINIRAIWRPHGAFNEVDVLIFIVVRECARSLYPAAVFTTCNDDILLWCQELSLHDRWRPPLSSPYEILRPTPWRCDWSVPVHLTLNTDISVFVLLGNVVTQYRCGGWKNLTFTRHKFLLVTVKEWLKSVLNYRSYHKTETGYPFLDHPV